MPCGLGIHICAGMKSENPERNPFQRLPDAHDGMIHCSEPLILPLTEHVTIFKVIPKCFAL